MMNILLTLDKNYLPPMRVLLTSLFLNNPGERFHIYIAGDGLEEGALPRALCNRFGAELTLLSVGDSLFAAAPTNRYYSRAMYYRLLAAQLLPQELDRALYLDPDMLVIGPLRALYDTDMGENLFAACIHKGLVDLSKPVNRVRLHTQDAEGYFNSGMLLMNLPKMRARIDPSSIFDYVDRNAALLILPDQDVLNALYADAILPLDERLYNYDARKYSEYLVASQGKCDIAWIMHSTRILHFCGKHKPWKKTVTGRFLALYRHYMALERLYGQS